VSRGRTSFLSQKGGKVACVTLGSLRISETPRQLLIGAEVRTSSLDPERADKSGRRRLRASDAIQRNATTTS
jgi:hypothetical protein